MECLTFAKTPASGLQQPQAYVAALQFPALVPSGPLYPICPLAYTSDLEIFHSLLKTKNIAKPNKNMVEKCQLPAVGKTQALEF